MSSPDEILVLRTCNPDRTSRNGFIWPESGWVEAPDWDPSPVCGGGLHGLPWGEGSGSLLDWSPDALWLAVAVPLTPVVDLDGKIKFPRGRVVYCGTREGATKYIYERAPGSPAIVGIILTGGDGSTLTGGHDSTLTGGDFSTLTGGDFSTLTGGRGSTLTGGDGSTLTGGQGSTLTGGDYSTLLFSYYDKEHRRSRRKLFEVGIDAEPGVSYRLNKDGEFQVVEVSDE